MMIGISFNARLEGRQYGSRRSMDLRLSASFVDLPPPFIHLTCFITTNSHHRILASDCPVLKIDEGREKSWRPSISFPPSARRMDTMICLAASDIISLHCSLSDEAMQILNAECLQHMKPGWSSKTSRT